MPMRSVSILIISLALLSSCRGVTQDEVMAVSQYKKEDTAELCHYLYFPIPDPSASKELKLLHYQAMQDELDFRGVNCSEMYPDNMMYRWESMLEKLR